MTNPLPKKSLELMEKESPVSRVGEPYEFANFA
jgi:hypothetical protein